MLFIGIYDFSKLCVSPKFLSSFVQAKMFLFHLPLSPGPLYGPLLSCMSTQPLRCKQITSSYIGLPTPMRTLNTLPPTEVFLKYSQPPQCSVSFVCYLRIRALCVDDPLPKWPNKRNYMCLLFIWCFSLETPSSRNRGGYFFVVT